MFWESHGNLIKMHGSATFGDWKCDAMMGKWSKMVRFQRDMWCCLKVGHPKSSGAAQLDMFMAIESISCHGEASSLCHFIGKKSSVG